MVGDGRSLPWPDHSFDVVHASLARPPPRAAGSRRVPRGGGPAGASRRRRERPRAGSAPLAGRPRAARGHDPQPVHAPRRAAVGATGVHAGRAPGPAGGGRAAARGRGRRRSPAIGSRSRRCGSRGPTRRDRADRAPRWTRSAATRPSSRRRRRRRRTRGCGARRSGSPAPGTGSCSRSGARPGAGARAACSRRPPRSRSCTRWACRTPRSRRSPARSPRCASRRPPGPRSS